MIIQKMGGIGSPRRAVPRTSASGRWCASAAAGSSALFLGEMLTATAMGYFEGEIERAVVLALFVPLIISSGGNSGSQATTLIIRSLALGEVRLRDWWRVFRRELVAGLALGALLGLHRLLPHRALAAAALHATTARTTCWWRSRSAAA